MCVAVPSRSLDFQKSFYNVFFMFNDLRREKIVCFVDHHCLNYFFKKLKFEYGKSIVSHQITQYFGKGIVIPNLTCMLSI